MDCRSGNRKDLLPVVFTFNNKTMPTGSEMEKIIIFVEYANALYETGDNTVVSKLKISGNNEFKFKTSDNNEFQLNLFS